MLPAVEKIAYGNGIDRFFSSGAAINQTAFDGQKSREEYPVIYRF